MNMHPEHMGCPDLPWNVPPHCLAPIYGRCGEWDRRAIVTQLMWPATAGKTDYVSLRNVAAATRLAKFPRAARNSVG
jgi:hypothetical protein